MTKKCKQILSVVLTLTLLLSVIPFCELQVTAKEMLDYENGYPLSVEFKTDKASYSSIGTAIFTVSLKNKSKNTIKNISVQSDCKDIQPINSDSVMSVTGISLNSGESYSFSYTATVNPRKLSFFPMLILFIKNLFANKVAIPNNNFDDGRSTTEEKVSVKFGSVEVTNTVKAWFDYDADVIHTETPKEFALETSRLAQETMNDKDFNLSEAMKNEFYAGRIIAKCVNSKNIDFEKYSPETVVYGEDGIVVLQFGSSGMAEKCFESLNNTNGIKYAEPDEIVCTESITDSNSEDISWGNNLIKADAYSHYLDCNNYSKLITVAVVDSGIDMDHPYYMNRILSSGYDYVGMDSDPEDENGHGTHVAGIISNCTKNLNVKIMPVRALDKNGVNYKLSVVNGINHAINNGADVINLSVGGNHSKYLDDAVNKAVEKGIVVCVAAGNGDSNHVPIDTANVCPAHLENAIVVSALKKDNIIASFSNYGESVDVAAPGVNIYSSYLNGEYKEMSGTSMATPFISACCAMFKLAYPSYSPKEIENLIKEYCIDLGQSGRDDYYGNGYINMYNAIPDCTVKYVTNGGNTVSEQKIKNSDEVKLPEPTKSFTVTLNANGGSVLTSTYKRDCELEGWYNNSALGGTRFKPGGSYTIISDETMYAKWDNPTLGAVEEPTRTGATFLGWYSAASGGTKYTSLTSITSSITLYAHWSVKKTGTITTSKAIDNRQLSVSWSSSGFRFSSKGNAVLCTGTGTSYSGEYIPTQGTWTKDTGLTSGGAVFEISNLSSIRSYIKSLNNGTLTKITVKATRMNDGHGMQSANGYFYACSNTQSGYKYEQKPTGTKVATKTGWERGKTASFDITDENVLKNFMGTGSADYKSIMLYAGSDTSDYVKPSSIEITFTYSYDAV